MPRKPARQRNERDVYQRMPRLRLPARGQRGIRSMDRRRIDPLAPRCPCEDLGRRAQAAASDGLRGWRMVLHADRPKAWIVHARFMPLRRHEDYRRAYRQHAARNASRGVPAEDPTQPHRCLPAAPGAMTPYYAEPGITIYCAYRPDRL